MRKLIIGILVLMLASIGTALATESINLCQKTINVNNSWGVCNETIPIRGVFNYNPIGSTLIFESSAIGLISGVDYSLIYYKDIDTLHSLPSTISVNILDTSIANESGVVVFSGNLDIGNIPSIDDVNPKGKIWIVNSSEIKIDGTLKWTGYGNGNIMNGYLFESDSIAQTENDGKTVQERMGGIFYTKTNSSTGTVIRTMNKSYLNQSLIGDSILVSLNENGNFQVSKIFESIPNSLILNMQSSNITVVKTSNGNIDTYEMTSISTNPINYTLSINVGFQNGSYALYGGFSDEDRDTGIISGDKNIIISGNSDTLLYLTYDANKNNRLEKDEILTAVVDFFLFKLELTDVSKIVDKYYDGTLIV